ncbi:MAG: hypothetical protein N2442_13010 [Spirochaetes bacterium]|nr:hypothetical protein [Spirochaetota bacterium]
MESSIQEIEILRGILQEEIVAFHRFIELEQKLQEGILSKNWKDLNLMLKSLKVTAKELVSLEEKREKTYRELRELMGVRKEESFYDFCFRFPRETREELFRLHRELKHSVVVVEGITSGIDTYCASTLSILGKFMDTLVPGWKHRVYSHKGVPKESEQPLLVNRAL